MSSNNVTVKQLSALVEELRKKSIGEPELIESKGVFEYADHSAKTVAILKLVRAVHGLNAMDMLCCSGFFIDFGVIVRCIDDCINEIYFLLEGFPKTSSNIDTFVESFFKSTIDRHLTNDTPPIPSKKIRAARVRYLKGQHDQETSDRVNRIYKTFCGYVHADYAHIMEVYNGGKLDFNLSGVLSVQERKKRMEYIEPMANSVLCAALYIAHVLSVKLTKTFSPAS